MSIRLYFSNESELGSLDRNITGIRLLQEHGMVSRLLVLLGSGTRFKAEKVQSEGRTLVFDLDDGTVARCHITTVAMITVIMNM